MLRTAPDADDVIEAMKLQRMRLAKDQGLRPWTPQAAHDITNEQLRV